MAHSLIVLPDDSATPILAAIDAAARTLRVKMFVFSDPGLINAVIAAKRRGVKVRVMLNPARRSGEHDNEATRRALERVDIDVKDANPAFTAMRSGQSRPRARQYIESLAATGRYHFDSREAQSSLGVSTAAAKVALNRLAKRRLIAPTSVWARYR